MSLDWQIYCQLYQQTADPMWGMFPHHSVGAVAKNVGVARETVWRRLKEWRRIGFLVGYEVIPNPNLLGVGFNYHNLTIPDPRARLNFLNELESVEGVFVSSVDFGNRANVILVSDLPSARARRERLVQRIEGVESMSRPMPVWLPACSSKVSKEGWRFIDALRRDPTVPLSQLAERLGISSKTASSRFRALRQDGALLGHPIENFAKFPGTIAGLSLTLKPGADARSVSRAVRRLQPNAWEAPSSTRRTGAPSSRLGFMWLFRNPWETDRVAAGVLRIPGVAQVTTFFPGTYRAYRQWFDARIYELMARTGL